MDDELLDRLGEPVKVARRTFACTMRDANSWTPDEVRECLRREHSGTEVT
ncbi:hypothetical protein HD597_011364 [Nonomuraea thailandensis]|uniref:Uncharacterized protein n=1 Tax=Nonomuraea thailandensis TaxID=1188745 RepID=A0A9X2K981_9ACTN|nr:hypothetical protein [Nonomuraea thailandensis]MCP2364344.1 hypothetical protein [Nonomuraea thailandensis]